MNVHNKKCDDCIHYLKNNDYCKAYSVEVSYIRVENCKRKKTNQSRKNRKLNK